MKLTTKIYYITSLIVTVLLITLLIDKNVQARKIETVPANSFEDKEAKIQLRDCAYLSAYIYRPNKTGKFPTIYVHTPYNKKHIASPLPGANFGKELLARDRYAYVVTDWRGYFGSTRAGKGMFRAKHEEDGYDVIEWIAKQPWSNGKVGMWGHSAVGSVQFKIAIKKPPHLVCIVPASGSIGFPYEQFYYGGVPQKHYISALSAVGHNKFPAQRIGLDRKGLQTKNFFWKITERAKDPDLIDLPMLCVSSWYDTHPALKLNTFKKVRTKDKKHYNNMKMIIGPWHHTAFNQVKQGDVSFPKAANEPGSATIKFFDHYLLGKKNGFEKEPAIRYFDMGKREWITSSSFPPNSNKNTNLYLSNTGKLETKVSKVIPGRKKFNYDPNNPSPTIGGPNLDTTQWKSAFLRSAGLVSGPKDQRMEVESRSDLIKFDSKVSDGTLAIIGTPKLELFCSTNCTDTDISARLTDVHPDGKSVLISDGIHRLSFRESLAKPIAAIPGKVYKLTIEMVPTAITLPAGHKLRLIVSSSNYPRFATNKNIFAYGVGSNEKEPKAKIATNTIFFDPKHLSKLTTSQ